jgi:hypothetical protein
MFPDRFSAGQPRRRLVRIECVNKYPNDFYRKVLRGSKLLNLDLA